MNICKNKLVELAENYFDNIMQIETKWPFMHLFCGEFIPDNRILNANQSYADINLDEEIILLLYDDTIWSSGKTGFIMTDTNFYFAKKLPLEKDFEQSGKYSMSDVYTIGLQDNLFGYHFLLNGESLTLFTSLTSKEAEVLHNFFMRLSRENLKSLRNDKEKLTEIQNDITRKLRGYMSDKEIILYLAYGTDLKSFVVCTTQCLIINAWNSCEEEVIRDIEYGQISSIDSWENKKGGLEQMLNVRLAVHASGSHTEITFLQPFQIEEIIRIVRNQKSQNVRKQTNEVRKRNITEEIRNLKDLLDSGALTQEEFNRAKRKLLEQL
jgi:hypothetical protein